MVNWKRSNNPSSTYKSWTVCDCCRRLHKYAIAEYMLISYLNKPWDEKHDVLSLKTDSIKTYLSPGTALSRRILATLFALARCTSESSVPEILEDYI